MKSCCITGHRVLPKEKTDEITEILRSEILQAIHDGYTHFISGFAFGVDLIFAGIVAELKEKNPAITLEAALTYRNRVKFRDKLFSTLIAQCNIVGVHSEQYHYECFFIRNRYMVEKSNRLIAVYDGREKGGTWYTMRYAFRLNLEIKIIHV